MPSYVSYRSDAEMMLRDCYVTSSLVRYVTNAWPIVIFNLPNVIYKS